MAAFREVQVSPVKTSILVFSAILGGAWLLLPWATYPQYLDDILYLSTAWEHAQYPHILNRYVTVYLAAGMNFLMGQADPVRAGQLLGSLTFLSILLLTYLNARELSPRQSHLAGFFAVISLLASRGFITEFGEVLADYTVTVWILGGFLIFSRAMRSEISRPSMRWWVLFGAIIWVALRTKETGFILTLPVLSLFIRWGGQGSVRKIAVKVGCLLMGALLVIGFFSAINAVMFGDPLFGFRPSEFASLVAFNTRQRPIFQAIGNDYWSLMLVAPPFIPALLALWGSRDNQALIHAMWIAIVGLIIFLDLSLVNGGWHLVVRYFMPGYALLSILAASTISAPGFKVGLSGLTSFVVVLFAGLMAEACFLGFGKAKGMGADYFYNGILLPAVAPLLLFILPKAPNRRRYHLLSLILFTAIVLPMAISNTSLLVSGKAKSEGLFAAFIPFREVVDCRSGSVVFSEEIPRERSLPIGNGVVIWEAFNLYYACHLPQGGLVLANDFLKLKLAMHDLSALRYVFLSRAELEKLLGETEEGGWISERFDFVRARDVPVILLVRKL